MTIMLGRLVIRLRDAWKFSVPSTKISSVIAMVTDTVVVFWTNSNVLFEIPVKSLGAAR